MDKSTAYTNQAANLLEKGIGLLWSQGYHATSVSDIVQAANTPKGSFYYYFKSKEDFAIQAIKKYQRQQYEPMLALLNDEGIPAKERLLKVYAYRVHVLKTQSNVMAGCLCINMASEMADHSEAIRLTILERHESVKKALAELVELAQKDGSMDSVLRAPDLIDFFEDAGRGAIISMKEKQDTAPLDNFIVMLKHFLY